MYEINLSLYSEELRGFINNDVKIVKGLKSYKFVSKKERYTFLTIRRIDGEVFSDIMLFTYLDGIFKNIIDQREANEIF